mgnify:CR=1 FL=1
MNSKGFSIWLIVAVVCLLPSTVFAMSPAQEDSLRALFRIDEVEVVATDHRQRGGEAERFLNPPQALKGDQLKALQVQSVADAIRYFSGVQIKDYGGVGGIKTVDMRSMGSQHVGVFYDGIEIGNAQNGTVDLGRFSMENLEAIELYHGQRAAQLQSAKEYGSSGTIYLRTRRPVFDSDKRYNVSVGMKAGTFGLANPSFLYEHKLTNDLHLSASAEYLYSTGRYHFRIQSPSTIHNSPSGAQSTIHKTWDTTGVRQNGDIHAVRAELGLFGYMPGGQWHVKGYCYNSERGIPRAIIRNVWTSEERQWDRNVFVQGSCTKEWKVDRFAKRPLRCKTANAERPASPERTLSLLVNAKYSNDYMRYVNPDSTRYACDERFWQQEVYLSAALGYDVFEWWNISLSGDYQWNGLRSDKPGFEDVSRHMGMVALATNFRYKWIAAQVAGLYTTYKDLSAEGGLSESETNGLSAQRSYSAAVRKVTPSVSVSYQPILREQFYIRALYKEAYRMPTFNDLYYGEVGVSDLEPEDAHQANFGIEYAKEFKVESLKLKEVSTLKSLKLSVKAEGFYNRVSNKIIAVPKGNTQYRWSMMNIGRVEDKGCELNAGLMFGFVHEVKLGLNLSYTYQRAQDKTTPGYITYNGQIAYVPEHSGSALVNLSWDGLTFNYSFIYVGPRYTASANIPINYEQPWYTHDIAIAKLWTIDRPTGCKTASLKDRSEGTERLASPVGLYTGIEINNLFNQQYEIIHNYPMPGINGKLVLRVEF